MYAGMIVCNQMHSVPAREDCGVPLVDQADHTQALLIICVWVCCLQAPSHPQQSLR